MNIQTASKRRRGEFVYIDAKAFSRLVSEEPCTATIGPAPADIAQQPWPTEPTLWNIGDQYVNEWVVPQHCDLQRSVHCLFQAYRVWDPYRQASSFTRADGRDFVNMRRADGVSDATIRREMTINMAAFGHAAREERIVKKPKFAKPKGGEPRVRFLTEGEERQLMLLPKPYRRQLFWLLAFGTGVRSAAIEGLRWSQVDLVNRVIDFRIPGFNHKTKRRPVAPINDRLLPRLIAAKARHDRDCPLDPYVIGKGCTTYAGCKLDMRAIGIDERGICRHVARHTFCSWRVQRGYSYALIGKLIGDTAGMVEAVYGHLSPEHLLKASNMDAMPLAA